MDYESIVRFKCPNCGTNVETVVLVEETPGSQSDLDGEVTETRCPRCGTRLRTRVWVTRTSSRVELIDAPDTVVEADPPIRRVDDDEGWEEHEYEYPPNPSAVFVEAIVYTDGLLERMGGEDGSHPLNRMIFVHRIGALEAYLCDELLKVLAEDEAAFTQLVVRHPELAQEKVTLAELSIKPDLLKTKVRSHLRNMVWHNLGKANAMYKAALDIDLFQLLGDDNKETLHRAIEHRHDCVHRNGADKDGNRLEVFTKEYVNQVGGVMMSLVHAIGQRFLQQLAQKWFGENSTPTESV